MDDINDQPVPEYAADTESAGPLSSPSPPPPPEKKGEAVVYLVEFKGSRKDHYRDPYHLPIRIGDRVIVQVERGEDMGRVVLRPGPKDAAEAKVKPLPILRIAGKPELDQAAANSQKEHEARRLCRQMVEERGLKMKVVDAEWQYDGNKVTFYFTAEKRVDFRQLVKDLAATYRTRIELRQIGARDEARRVGGLGICGYEQCCTMFLKEFEPVTTQLARDQNLSLNPAKISGNCGRLLCCLRYESGFYQEATRQYPRVGSEWTTESGTATVDRVQILHERIIVRGADGTEQKIPLIEIKKAREKKKSWFD